MGDLCLARQFDAGAYGSLPANGHNLAQLIRRD
jgi:hypothetical protein